MPDSLNFDGNTEQIRAIVDQIFTSFANNPPRAFIEAIDARITERLAAHQSKVENRMMRWFIAQFIGIAIAAFFLGGLYMQMARIPTVLEARGDWMSNKDSWQQAINAWAEPQGFKPPAERKATP